jgi:hypothetical protein
MQEKNQIYVRFVLKRTNRVSKTHKSAAEISVEGVFPRGAMDFEAL